MKQTFIIGAFVLSLPFFSVAQTAEQAGHLGDSAHQAKNYALAIQFYTKQAAAETLPFVNKNTWYNIACCYALAGDRKNAWTYLQKSLKAGYNDYAHVLTDSDLDSLHSVPGWEKFAVLNREFQQRLGDPLSAKLVTTDIHHFWDAYDRVQKDTAHARQLYTTWYFDKASPGLQDYYITRIFSVENFVKNQQSKRNFYRAIRQNTLKTDKFKTPIQQSFVRLKQLYDSAIFPNVYFLIGRWTSAGTVSGNGLLIGVDMMSKTAAVPLEELSLWENNNYTDIDNLPYLVAHELIHSQQLAMKDDTTTLAACIQEGMADFIGELISGKNSDERLVAFTKGKERLIWNDFKKDIYLKHAYNWLYNSGQATADHPADLGYWVGYQICKSYYEEATDKKKAVKDMLHIQDYRAFLTKSRYEEKIDTLASGVYNISSGKPAGSTTDLALFKAHASTLAPGQTNHPSRALNDAEELIFIKEGLLKVSINDTSKILGPGSIVLIMAGDTQSFQNVSDKPATYYVLSFTAKSPVNIPRGRQKGGSMMIDWATLRVKKTDKGESRPILDRPTSMFSRLEVHATALNSGMESHAPHTHRSEEIMLLMKGNATAYIGGKKGDVVTGDIMLLTPNIIHNVTNTGTGQCWYYAIKWENSSPNSSPAP
jgi:quercetin dioxygenase-like cupin family protein